MYYRPLNLLFFIISAAGAFTLDAFLPFTQTSIYMPPLLFFVSAYWVGRLSVPAVFVLIFVGGIIVDSLHSFPFGTYTAILLAGFLLRNWFENLLPRTRACPQSLLKAVMVIIISWAMIIPISMVLNKL